MNDLFRALVLGALAFGSTAWSAEEVSKEKAAEAQDLLEEMASELTPLNPENFSKEQQAAYKLLQDADVALLEAHAWLKRELPSEAGIAFIRSGESLAGIPEELRALLQPRLGEVERRRLSIARQFLEHDYLVPSEEPEAPSDASSTATAPKGTETAPNENVERDQEASSPTID